MYKYLSLSLFLGLFLTVEGFSLSACVPLWVCFAALGMLVVMSYRECLNVCLQLSVGLSIVGCCGWPMCTRYNGGGGRGMAAFSAEPSITAGAVDMTLTKNLPVPSARLFLPPMCPLSLLPLPFPRPQAAVARACFSSLLPPRSSPQHQWASPGTHGSGICPSVSPGFG